MRRSARWKPSCTDTGEQVIPGARADARALFVPDAVTCLVQLRDCSCESPRAGHLLLPVGAGKVGQRGLHIVQMRLDRAARGPSIARHQRIADRAMLIQQQITRLLLPEHRLPVIEQPRPQQIEHRPHHMQHDDIVAGLDDRHVKLGIQLRLVRRIAFGMGGLHLLKQAVDHRKVGIGPQPRGSLCRQPLQSRRKAI